MSVIEILSIIFIHWVADFVLQTDKQAKGKSKNWKDLLGHTLSYSLVWIVVGSLFKVTDIVNWQHGLLTTFVLITFICHTITDYFTSRLNSYLWIRGDVHNFFVSVGFDQVLHYIQLFVCYQLIFK